MRSLSRTNLPDRMTSQSTGTLSIRARSVLASEIYRMVNRVDMAIAIRTTLKMITGRLELPVIPMIVYTDSYSLYKCLVKLGTTKEKRFMIDIIALW
jgi:hypothetical protein